MTCSVLDAVARHIICTHGTGMGDSFAYSPMLHFRPAGQNHFGTTCNIALLARPAVDVDSPIPRHAGAPHGIHDRAAELGLQSQQLLSKHFSIQPILHITKNIAVEV